MAQLTLTDITKSFGNFDALKGVSLDISSGEFICLLGASGCGKTTLLRIIAGLEAAGGGTMLLDGEDLSQTPCHERNVGMVFQSLALFPHLNVAENIAYGLKLRTISTDQCAAKVEELLAMVGLDGLGKRAVSALSGGQRQRVAIARALAIEPKIFLMDEPFSALDAGLRDHLQLEVKKLQQRLGVTTVFVTHDQREAMSLADRIVVLNDGRVEQIGTPSEVYAAPASRFVAEFIGTNNILDVTVTKGVTFLSGVAIGAPLAVGSGETQTIAVRPEHIELSALEPEQTQRDGLIGKVLFERRLGAVVEREISAQDGALTLRQTSLTGASGSFSTGERVKITFDLSHAVPLTR